MKNYRLALSALLSVLFVIQARAQVDTVFWFAAPEITMNIYGSSQRADRPVIIRIATYASAATVTISQPAGGGMPTQTVNIPANSTQSVDLTAWIDQIETKPPNTPLNYGLKITATTPVSVYYDLRSECVCNTEYFVLKGHNALGTDFIIPAQNLMENDVRPGLYTPTPYSSFDIVATENNTTVTVTPANDIVGHAAGSTFTVTLNEGQVWSAAAVSGLPANQLGGSRVTSDKPVAITVKEDLLFAVPGGPYTGGCGDAGGDQIVPVHLMGTEYVAMTGRMNGPGDQLFITAIRNGTTVTRDGGPVLTTINAGETYRIAIGAGGGATYIRTSEPVCLWQLSGVGCEQGTALIPQIHCTGSSEIAYVRSLNGNLYINLLVRSGGQGDFLVNGAAGVITAAQFTAVSGTANQWYAAQVEFPLSTYPQGNVIRISNTSSLFQMGALDAGSNGGNFGYFSDFAGVRAAISTLSPYFCTGDEMALFTDTTVSATYNWTGPNGFSSNQPNPVIPNVSVADSGMYIVTVSAQGCTASDTLNVPVFERPVADLGQDTSFCADTITLQSSVPYTGAPSYLWSTAATTPSIQASLAGSYWLAVTINGCTGSDTVTITLTPDLIADLGPDLALCDRDTPVILRAPQPPGTRYLWSNGLSDTQMSVTRTGNYWVFVERNGCTGSDSIHVHVVRTPEVYIGRDTTICEQTPLQIGMELPGAVYTWNTGATTPFIYVNTTGSYRLEMNLEGCIVSDTIDIIAMPAPQTDLGPDGDICPEQTIILNGSDGGNNTYVWGTGETTPSIPVTSAGRYWIQVTSEYGCTGSDTILLAYYPEPVISLGADTVVCEETPLLLTSWYTNTDSVIWSDGRTGYTLTVQYGGTYVATAVNKCGMASDTIEVRQIFCDIWLPNVFTPNGDGINDVFRVLGNTGRMDGFKLSLFNRWGQLVFVTTDKYQGWDGTQKGNAALLGTYVYMLEYNIDGRPYLQKGNFHLLR